MAAIRLIGTTAYTEDFNTLATSGTANTLLPNGWEIVETGGGTRDNEQYAAGTGSDNTGDTYSFGATGSTERALGGLQSGSLVPTLGASFTNDTGSLITTLNIAYTGEQWRLGTSGRADRIDFQYSLDATSLTTGSWINVDALDFTAPITTGTVGALNGNAAANRTAISSSITGLSIASGATVWIRWNSFDAAGADDGLAIDDFSISTPTVTPPPGPTVTITASPNSTTEGSTTSGLFTITRTGDTTNPLTVNFTTGGTATSGSDYLAPDSFTTNSIVIPAGQNSVSIAITPVDDTNVEAVENVTVTLSASANYTVGASNTASVTLNDNDVPITTLISQIQGSGTAATAGTFTIEGIVIGDFQGANQLGGFYLQEEDTDRDGSDLTSEGIFVNSLFAVNVGDRVRLTGLVQENASTPSFNQAVITPGAGTDSLQITGTGLQSQVTSTVVNLPTVTLGDLERYEGMLVTFAQTLTVTDNFNLGRFGEVVLSANGRLFQPTNFIDPNDNPATGTNSTGTSNVAAVTAQQNLNDRSRIILDDGSSASNLSDVPYINTTDANPLNDTLRLGSTTTGLTGVMGFGFSNYRIQPTQAPTFDYAPRPTLPAVGGNLKVASFNVLNYFNGDGLGGGFPTSRGADTSAEFDRQRTKIIAAINGLNADVVGLIEMENDGDGPNSAIVDLVNGLNAVAGAGTYDYIRLSNTTGSPGSDEIKVAFIYKPGAVTPVGNAVYFNDAAFDTARPPLAQTFRANATGEIFTPIINHFKSKGSAANLPGDTDQGDGQALSNATRKAQATALLNFVTQIQTSSGDADVMVLGDLNAYNEEDPIDILRAGGLTKLVTPTESYVFQGQTGSLDHALVTSSLLGQVTGAAKWNINADEPITLDYNDDTLSTGENTAEDRNDTSLYAPTPFRSSDHDPVLVGLNLVRSNAAPTAVNLVNPVTALLENTSTTTRIKVADLNITDDGIGTNVLSLSGPDASFFELDGAALFLKAGTPLDFETKASYAVTVNVDDAAVGSTPDASVNYTLTVQNQAVEGVDLSNYVRIGRYNLPEPTRTTAPTGSRLAQEVSAVTYNSDTDTLFVVGDAGTSIVQVSKTGQLIDSMTLAPGAFNDPEGLTYVGNGKFVLMEERLRQANLFTYVPNATLTRSDVQAVKLGTTVGNIGLEGVSFDPLTNGYIAVKELTPQGIFQTGIDFAAGTATNGSPTTVNSTNLFDPALANLGDFADVYALSNLPGLTGTTDFSRLLVLSQESGKIVNIDRSGNIASSLTLTSDPGNPLSVADQGHEGLTMDRNGFLYVVSEEGGGDINNPQLWVYAPASFTFTNQAPVGVSLSNTTGSLAENTSTATRVKVGNIVVSDDALGTNNLSLTGPDASSFEISGTELFLKAGTVLDFETKTSYGVTVNVNDPTVGGNPDASIPFTLAITDVTEAPSPVVISEVAPWSSGNSSIGADWFELTNTSSSAVNITGWKFDDESNSATAAATLNGITSIAPGESVIFVESATPATTIASFRSVWFGGNAPANLQIGTYTGSGIGLSTSADAVNLFTAAGTKITGVNFGASTPASPFRSFDNAAGLQNSAITTLSTVGVNGAFSVTDGASTLVGSPGRIATPNVIVNGTPNRDTLTGGATNDIITGFEGRDTITTGSGNDVVVYKSLRDGSDIVDDFTTGTDKFDLSAIFSSLNLSLTYAQATSQGYLEFRSLGRDAAVQVDPDGTAGRLRAVTLASVQNTTVAALNNANNFLL